MTKGVFLKSNIFKKVITFLREGIVFDIKFLSEYSSWEQVQYLFTEKDSYNSNKITSFANMPDS